MFRRLQKVEEGVVTRVVVGSEGLFSVGAVCGKLLHVCAEGCCVVRPPPTAIDRALSVCSH